DRNHLSSSDSVILHVNGSPSKIADFNGDGYADVAIGVPLEDVGSAIDAGGVNVIYGSSARLTSTGNQFWTQDSPEVLDASGSGDLFGAALAAGDFNGDGLSDLAIGAPYDDPDDVGEAGAVNVLYGSTTGLAHGYNQFWTQKAAGLGSGYPGDLFGSSLAAGDLNGDGYADLVVGVPLKGVNSLDAGAAAVLYGSLDGLTTAGGQLWTQNSPGILDKSQIGDLFGWALAVGDFNGNGYADLAIGVPLEDAPQDHGAVNVIYGSSAGLTSTGNQVWSQDSRGIVNPGEAGDAFGFSLAVGSFEGDKYEDLAVGIPYENIGSKVDAGAVSVIYGRSTGLSYIRNQFWSQDTTGVVDSSERYDRLGYSLAGGDFNGSGRDDLAIGVPTEDVSSVTNPGAVAVLYGGRSKLTTSANQLWHQNSSGIRDTAERHDQFGFALAVGDFNGHKYDDLAIGVDLENVGSIVDAGAAAVIYGSSSRLGSARNQFWTQDSPGIMDEAEAGDVFGGTVASGVGQTMGADRRSPLSRLRFTR
ncbi:MAG: hypothetical protein ACRDHO_10120, partial [Actinomycetota bacterium]